MAAHEAGNAASGARDSLDSEADSQHSTARFDQETLNTEEEAERLLMGVQGQHKSQSRSKRRKGKQKKWRGSRDGDASELMLKIEEGGRSSDDSANSSDVDARDVKSVKSSSKLAKCGRFTALHIIILVAFIAFAYGAYKATLSLTKTAPSHAAKTLSNGTHEFAPTTILISLDGFRADFLHRGLTPTLSSFIQQGVSPRYMMPSFPSLTFPNHFTLVTGLYPSEHGIVGNNFYDPIMQKQFTYADPSLSMVPEYWNADPIWETAELQGIKTAIHMWPGSEAHIGGVEPEYVDKYNGHEELKNKVNRVLGWLDLPGPSDFENELPESGLRPQLICAYVPNVDSDGHLYGPNSTYIRSTIAEVDGMLASLFSGIEARNLTEIVNVVVVSDHGMATTDTTRLIQLDDLLDTNEIEHTDGWPLYGLRPFNQSEAKLAELYKSLKSQESVHDGSFKVFLRDDDMPERYHFARNQRIAPLWIVPEVGFAIAPKHEFDVAAALENGEVYAPRGLHGYDNDHPLMRAIFVARGPSFPHPKGSMVDPFYNTNVYGIICDTLGIEPRPNNGTIRLPFTTTGLHDSEAYEQPPDDPPPIAHVDIGGIVPTIEPPKMGAGDVPPPEQSEPKEPAAMSQDEEVGKNGQSGDDSTSWRQWIDGKIDQVKTWVTGLFGEHKQDPSSGA